MAAILFDIVVQPLVLLIEFVFAYAYRLIGSPGGAIVCVSLAVNLLCLPLYRMADERQEREREKQQSMEHWVSHIKAHFKGDERYMMLSAYYALEGYHPARALLGSLSLLLQIPFFMAAYSYLSHLSILSGASFLFLPDLGAPDALLHLGGITVNVMPVAMTIFNCVSTAIYTKGLPMRDKVQAYGLAAVFLVLLYDSPSGLVFYWTCNQVFSLGKNVFMKVLPNPTVWAQALAEVCICGAFAWLVLTGRVTTLELVLGNAVLFTLIQAFMIRWILKSRRTTDAPPEEASGIKGYSAIPVFFLAATLLTVLMGLLIPASVIANSPTEFIDPNSPSNPLTYVVHATCVWGGTFVLWVGTYFLLSGPRARRAFSLVMWCLCGVCALSYFAFGTGLGTISPELVYDKGIGYELTDQLVNGVALAGLAVLCALIWRHVPKIVTPALVVGTLALTALAAPSIATIASAYETYPTEQNTEGLFEQDGTPKQILHLSKSKNNVVVLFMDRAISGYVPYLMAERPELAKQFDGFTYYPNTISFGCSTNLGAPALYGGYEYTPTAMNARSDTTIPNKHNEALLLMPTLFSKSGFRTTVVDPPYAGAYRWEPDLSIYDNLPNTQAIAVTGRYASYDMPRYGIASSKDMNRQFVMYGLVRTLPACLQAGMYDGGHYWSTRDASTVPTTTRNEFSTLDILPEITTTEGNEGGFVLMCNCLTHEPSILQLPDYDPAPTVNNKGLENYDRFVLNGKRVNMDTEHKLGHYHVNATAFIRLGRWFDWMRENDVYNNTRIIIVADHGRDLYQFEGWKIDDYLDIEMVNPLLMVKDFDAHGFATSDDFMTNADVPALALQDVVEDAVNPATGNEISTDEKTAHDQYVTASQHWETWLNEGYTFNTSDAPWYAVHSNIFDLSNWQRLEGEPEVSV